jgi:hypothetical protein
VLLGHAEVGGLVDDEPVELLERALVDESGYPLPGGPLAGAVLSGDPLGPAAELRSRPQAGELGESLVEAHGDRLALAT